MQVAISYGAIILIWGTTPLAIHWSNDAVHFTVALTVRIAGAAVLGLIILWLSGNRLVHHRHEWRTFIAGALGLFPTMLLVYWAAQSVPSGIMSVIFGLFPFVAAGWSAIILKASGFGPRQWFAVVIALAGLILLNLDVLNIDVSAVWGIAAIIIATNFWALSAVWLKTLPPLPPFRQSVGAALVASPALLIVCLCVALITGLGGVEFDEVPSIKSYIGITYLIVFGSLVGHTLFFLVLARCSVATVSLIPLITPLMALFLGWAIEGESLTLVSCLGAAMILLALAVFQGFLSGFVPPALRQPRDLRFWRSRIIKPVSAEAAAISPVSVKISEPASDS